MADTWSTPISSLVKGGGGPPLPPNPTVQSRSDQPVPMLSNEPRQQVGYDPRGPGQAPQQLMMQQQQPFVQPPPQQMMPQQGYMGQPGYPPGYQQQVPQMMMHPPPIQQSQTWKTSTKSVSDIAKTVSKTAIVFILLVNPWSFKLLSKLGTRFVSEFGNVTISGFLTLASVYTVLSILALYKFN